jgi:hypothetical protein
VKKFEEGNMFESFLSIPFSQLIKKGILFHFNYNFSSDPQVIGRNFELHLYITPEHVRAEIMYLPVGPENLIIIDRFDFSYSRVVSWQSFRNRGTKTLLGKYLIIDVDHFLEFLLQNLFLRIEWIRNRTRAE